jgi:hypothetical protein
LQNLQKIKNKHHGFGDGYGDGSGFGAGSGFGEVKQ